MSENIAQIVEIQSGYTSYVDLEQELFDDARNIGRMSRYRPIKSHRDAFDKMARALNVQDGRCYLLTGSYGTGKSHLCLMYANYMRTPSGEPPMPEFFEHYADVDPNQANTLRDKRLKKRYLVALCKWGGKGDFEEIVLNAMNNALSREGFGEDFDTYYLQAIKKIEEWEKLAKEGGSNGRFLAEFKQELIDSNSGTTLNQFKKQLKGFDQAAMSEFRRLHQKVTTAPFAYDKADLNEILENTLASKKFKEVFAGVLVLFDEFGYTLEQGNLSPKAFQRFAQLCGETPTKCAPIVFVGTAHKALTQYAKAYGSDDFRTASDRIKEIPLATDGVEEIIGAIVVPQKNHALWKTEVASHAGTFDSFTKDCQRLKLFDWLKAPEIRNKIIENIYPMHPMATYALLRLARDVGSNNRSVFTFFSDDPSSEAATGSYGDFVFREPILKNNKLNLYTADRLFDYFGGTLESDNRELRDTVRDHIKAYENSLRTLNEAMANDESVRLKFENDPLVMRLLRLILIYEIVEVVNRKDNLEFGLYCVTQSEKDQLSNLATAILKHGVLYQNKDTGVLEFKNPTAFDLDRRIEEYKHDPKNQPQNLVVEINELVPLSAKNDLYLEAKDYNLTYSEDKRLERRFVRAADLETEREVRGEKKNYFDILEEEIKTEATKNGEFEGIALYVVGEKPEDLQKAKNLCTKNSSDRIVVAIAKQPVPLEDAIMELRALLDIEKGEDKKNFTVQDNAALGARLHGDSVRSGAKKELERLRDQLMNAREVTWHGKFAQVVPTDSGKQYDAANRVMDALYAHGRNLFSHDDFNKLRVKVDKSKNTALKEAVEELAAYTEPIVVDTEFAQQRGDIRYLQKCLLHNGVLKQKKSSGSKLTCEFEGKATNYQSKLPALAAMVKEIEALPETGKIRLADWSTRYRSPEFGQGPVALALLLACLRRRFGDSICFKMDESAVGNMPVRSFEDILKLSTGEYANAYVSYKPLTAAENDLANMVYGMFGSSTGAQKQHCTLSEAHDAIKAWANELPQISKVSRLYDADKHPHTAAFIEALQRIDAKDAHAFLFDELPRAFGLDASVAITSGDVPALEAELGEEKKVLEGALSDVEERIVKGVRQVFNVAGNTHSDLLDAVKEWYNGLDSGQRDIHAAYHTNESKPLIVYLGRIDEVYETFLNQIPNSPDYNLRQVRDWAQDKVVEYISRIASGKELIDNNCIKVEPPKVILNGDDEWQDNGAISFQDKLQIELRSPSNGGRIFVTEGSDNPTDANATREEYSPDKPFVIKESKQLNVAVQDSEGNWSPVVTVPVINSNKPFEPVVNETTIGERHVEPFNFPNNEQSLKVTCRTIFRKSLELGIVNPAELKAAVEAAMKEAQQPKED